MKSFITGLSGLELTNWEAAFLREQQPAGLILFGRNISNPEQVKRLIDASLHALGDRQRLVLVDQEGGRVSRLKPPHWPKYPPGRVIGSLYQRDPDAGKRAAYLAARLIAADLLPLGFNVDCLPLLDCGQEGMTDAIGDRAYASDPQTVAVLGQQACLGMRAGGLLPTIKHMPGHGRAVVDSHYELPIVSADRGELDGTDFVPFRELKTQPIGMTAHIRFTDLDEHAPATLSAKVISAVIREAIGFDGLLLTDDISMKALGGSMYERCTLALEAGCDLLLHCNGQEDEMTDVARAACEVKDASLQRFSEALEQLQPADAINVEASRREFLDLLSPFWSPSG